MTTPTSDPKTVPAYVDTKTPAVTWHLYNLLILIASLGMGFIASLLVEYEIAKLTHPGIGFIQTPLWLVLTLAGLVIALAITNLAVLILVFVRHLWLRRWMLATVITGWVLLAILALTLNDSLLYILIPGYRSPL